MMNGRFRRGLCSLFQFIELPANFFGLGPLLVALLPIHGREVVGFLHELVVLRLQFVFLISKHRWWSPSRILKEVIGNAARGAVENQLTSQVPASHRPVNRSRFLAKTR